MTLVCPYAKKIRYPCRRIAEEKMREMMSSPTYRHNSNMRAYHCKKCGCWHFGHPKPWQDKVVGIGGRS